MGVGAAVLRRLRCLALACLTAGGGGGGEGGGGGGGASACLVGGSGGATLACTKRSSRGAECHSLQSALAMALTLSWAHEALGGARKGVSWQAAAVARAAAPGSVWRAVQHSALQWLWLCTALPHRSAGVAADPPSDGERVAQGAGRSVGRSWVGDTLAAGLAARQAGRPLRPHHARQRTLLARSSPSPSGALSELRYPAGGPGASGA
ncbi:hypothetical protein PLESTF_001473100 [Pleodorina starrii]|nr:hypothetical protein PLESTF_001473100 [Pleodorina starrii]